jgi:hypothetical protein
MFAPSRASLKSIPTKRLIDSPMINSLVRSQMSNEAKAVGEALLLREASDKFMSTFGRKPVVAACAPGRVNLIGEHIDYCEGFVLPVVSMIYLFIYL